MDRSQILKNAILELLPEGYKLAEEGIQALEVIVKLWESDPSSARVMEKLFISNAELHAALERTVDQLDELDRKIEKMQENS